MKERNNIYFGGPRRRLRDKKDLDLWRRACRGDANARDAVARIVAKLAGWRLRRLRLPLVEREDIEGSVQLTVLETMRARPETPRASLRSWLRFRVRAEATKHFRRRNWILTTEGSLDEHCQTVHRSPLSALVHTEFCQALAVCMARLPKKQRAALLSRDEHASTARTAIVFEHANPSTVRVRIYRSVRRLRSALAKRGHGPGE